MERTAGVTKGTALMGMMVAMMMVVPGTGAAACKMETVEKAAYGPYSGKACVVANSEAGWHVAMKALEDANALAILPAPEPPTGIDWANEVVVVVAAGNSGYDIELLLTSDGNGLCKVEPKWVRLAGQDGGNSLPYHVVKMPKVAGLDDVMVMDGAVDTMLPLVSGGNPTVPAGPKTWGQLKAAYR
jgi:hypothetical protein